ncbi:TetR/AcrR family transcriptional regulator [Celerinatantimonas sp. YJH-8]|uniref:TetR/AcrR family transcriptional regulator n=1 Tax=Celerinatantimonas sp. YJH-8 TaxID=3228714 RepID=UPI0038C83380
MTEEPQKSTRGRRQSGLESGRKALLKAAMVVFSKHGYDSGSLRAIARRANVDVALCARLFGGKAQLWQAVIDSLVAIFEHDIKEQLEQLVKLANTAPYEAMRQFIVLYAKHCTANPEFPAFFLQEAVNSPERMAIIREQLMRPMMHPVLEIAQKAKVAGVVRFDDPIIFIRMLTNSISLLLAAPEQLPKRTLAAGNLTERIMNEAINIYLHSPETEQLKFKE